MRAPNVSVEILNYRRSNRRRDQEAGELSVMWDGMTVVNAGRHRRRVHLPGPRRQFLHQRKPSGQIDARPATPVLPGDVIIVRERFF